MKKPLGKAVSILPSNLKTKLTKTVDVPYDLIERIEMVRSDYDFDGPSMPVNAYSVPKIIISTFDRVQRSLLERERDYNGSEILSAIVSYGREWIAKTPESVNLISAIAHSETIESLSPRRQVILHDVVNSLQFKPADGGAGCRSRWTFRLNPLVAMELGNYRKAVSLDKAGLTIACIMKGLAGLPGCSPEITVIMNNNVDELILSFEDQANEIRDLIEAYNE